MQFAAGASYATYGSPKFHGFRVSERTVSRYMRMCRSKAPSGASWKTFSSNPREVLAAMEFFTVLTVTFRLLDLLLVVQQGGAKSCIST